MKQLYFFIVLLFLASPVFGKHIIGGVITYKCEGGGKYSFVMKVYRDCSDISGADFDFQAPIAFFEGDNPTPIQTLLVVYSSIQSIDPDVNDPCLQIPPNVCVEEGIYLFEYEFPTWPNDVSYHVVYQRCCRNATVTNIVTPGDVGATFSVEINPASQALCNSSPVFETLPPIVICAGEPLNFDHSATDPEGDQLIYELCEPLIGGGLNFSSNGCDGVAPNPPCGPPFGTVQFVPPFSPLNPLGGDPPVTIEPVTGLLTGTPEVMGQFTVGVCVSEFRNGELLTVVRRDLQFNVANCEPLVVADIAADEQVSQDSFVLNLCHGLQTIIENNSFQQNFIDSFFWEFTIDDHLDTIYTWDADLTFPRPGEYHGSLYLNPGSDCGDTAYVFVAVHPETKANFTFDFDTCVAGPVDFTDLSLLGASLISRRWDFGDGDTDNKPNPLHLFSEPGDQFVKLTVRDENGCEDDTLAIISYTPVPALIIISPTDTVSCPPASIFFDNLSTPIDETYDIAWNFGDSGTGTLISPTHTYREEGKYDVSVEITSPIGCFVDTLFENLITIEARPKADFVIDPPHPDNLNPQANFLDRSLNAVHWDWYVDGQLISQEQSPSYTFPDTGFHQVQLVVTHPKKCQDTLAQMVDVEPLVLFRLPNAFTPNNDSVNDFFMGIGVLPGISNFRMQIWDRWGNMVFETKDPGSSWNGLAKTNGQPAQAGVYVYLVSFTGPRGHSFDYHGYATLIR